MVGHADLARQFRANLSTQWSKSAPVRFGVVHAVHTGPPKTVDVYVEGSSTLTTSVRYDSAYSPVASDTVYMLRVQVNRTQCIYLVLGKLA